MTPNEEHAEARIQVVVEDSVTETLDDLTKILGLKSRAQTITTALSLLEWAAQEAADGKKIASIENEHRFTELMLPCFQRFRRGKKKPTVEQQAPVMPHLVAANA